MVEMLFCEDDSCADKATANVQNTLMPASLEIVTNLCIHHDGGHQKNLPYAEECKESSWPGHDCLWHGGPIVA